MKMMTAQRLLLLVAAVVAMLDVGAAASPCGDSTTCTKEVCPASPCRFSEFSVCKTDCATCKPVYTDVDNVQHACDKLILKCRLMHLEMLNKKKGSRSRGLPEGGRQDTDAMYDPDCDINQQFNPKQCDNSTQECWCVNSAGVRNSDKSKGTVNCPKLVSCSQIVLDFFLPMDHVPTDADKAKAVKDVTDILQRSYLILPEQMKAQLLDTGNMIVTLTQNVSGNPMDIATVAHLAEKRLKDGKLETQDGLVLNVDPTARKPIVWFFDDEPPTMTVSRLAPGIIALIVIAVLAAVAAAVIFFWWKKQRETKKYNRAHKEQQELQDTA